MTFSKLILNSAIASLLLTMSAIAHDATSSQPAAKQPASKPNEVPYNLHPETDKTDIYDLPVGNDEYDQEQEMDELQETEKKEQNKDQK